MKQMKVLALLVVAFALIIPCSVIARGIDPVVSVEWLDKNLATPNLVVVDIRKVEDYNAGHIPGAINIFYNILAPGKGDMKNELPADDDLRDVLSANAIGANSLVVVAGINDTPPDRFRMTRAAMTFIYAGIPNVAVLDGGTTKWAADGKAVSKDAVKPKAKDYKGKFNKGLFVNKDVVAGNLGKVILIDVREPDFYNGVKKLDFVARLGHIKGAVNLPAGSQLFTKEGTYKPMADLKPLAMKAAGEDLGKEIILYCDTGMVATSWWLLMTQSSFGYTDVKVYDGSSQDWAGDKNLPMEP
jgi:thiosulfate/3-mercaptopyruvate sulfurtransferase